MALSVVDESWLREHVREKEAFEAVKLAFYALGVGALSQPPVQQLSFPGKGETCIKSAYLQGNPYGVVKLASGFPGNVEKGTPSGSGLMIVLDASNGVPRAVLQDGGYLTDLRTGAAGALAVDLLCRPSKLNKIAILGSGVQARFQLRAVNCVREWTQAAVYSRNPGRLQGCVDELNSEFGGRVTAAASFENCVRGADLVITTTSASSPLVLEEWLQEGATVVAVGSDTPGKQELSVGILNQIKQSQNPGEAVNKKLKLEGKNDSATWRLVCDSTSQCTRLGELQHAADTPVSGELGQILVGSRKGRQQDGDVIICDLTGCGAQDAAIAQLAFAAFLDKAKL